MRNNLRQAKVVIYRLKRNYGEPVHILYNQSLSHDVRTGEVDRQEEVINVKRAIVMTPKVARQFSYDLSFIAANKNFTYGGFYDASDRVLLLDAKDLPKDYFPDINHRCVYDHQRYEFSQLLPVTGNYAYMIHLKHVEGSRPEDIIEQRTGHRTTITQEEDNAINS